MNHSKKVLMFTIGAVVIELIIEIITQSKFHIKVYS
jgi:hypothetical protein